MTHFKYTFIFAEEKYPFKKIPLTDHGCFPQNKTALTFIKKTTHNNVKIKILNYNQVMSSYNALLQNVNTHLSKKQYN